MTFYDNNQLIAFPLTGVDVDAIPSSVIVDTVIYAPSSLGTQLQLLSISVTDLVVSCVLGINGISVAYITQLQANTDIHVPYDVTPIVPGVVGFMTFGEGIRTERLRVDGTFPFMHESLISFVYNQSSPTLTAGGNPFFGMVTLEVGTGLTISGQTLTIRKEDSSIVTTPAALISILTPSLYNDPIPPCLLPADANVVSPPIRSINGVAPTTTGAIFLTLEVVKQLPAEPDIDQSVPLFSRTIYWLDHGQPCES